MEIMIRRASVRQLHGKDPGPAGKAYAISITTVIVSVTMISNHYQSCCHCSYYFPHDHDYYYSVQYSDVARPDSETPTLKLP